ncbi:hypothetical protein P872_08510 [Rhodonellum psychrophilum GCM71 = DSM 17998]|uniref:NADPH-dependent FMN reductase-like domain-containing protein n=2 Tax=Rhodonellum TaxID=336827 RepID=U5BZK1_9BACT|nr:MULTISPECIES: NAD(P)H-dependent oxidoreductase [Rhodonellum]ERM82101.1 hypothetical protein P872_08510 [Rhodonellum psychrophilum GCM71 = DSM 17998]SDZ17753.1 azobenzene reductase [Rhodonellum ikkaensis]
MSKILIISGSPRQSSVSIRIANFLTKELEKDPLLEIERIDLRQDFLPPIQKVWSAKDQASDAGKILFSKLERADGILLVSPEYNGSYSSSMKNLLDHFPRPLYENKVFGIATGSTGAMGGMRAAQQLISLVVALFGILSPRLLVTPHMDKKFNAESELIDESFSKNTAVFLKEFLWLLRKIDSGKE